MDELRIASLAVAGMLAIVFTVFTVRQESAWKDDLTVFTVAHQAAPHNTPVALNLARAHVQVALQLGEAGRCNEAVVTFNEVIREFPQDWYAWAGLGECQLQLNDLAKAEQSLHRAAELSHEPRVMQEWQELRAQWACLPRLNESLESVTLLQLPAQCLHYLVDRLLIAAVPTPLPLLHGRDQSGLRQDGHVVRDGRLRKVNFFFDVPCAQAASSTSARARGFRLECTLFQRPQNAAPGRVGNGAKRTIERSVGRHG